MRDSVRDSETCTLPEISGGHTACLDEEINSKSQSFCSVPPMCSSTCHTTSYCMIHCVSQPCMPVSNIGPTRILPYLYLGSQRDALCHETLAKNGITYIVNVTTSIPRPSVIQEMNFHRIPIDDTYLDRLAPFFKDAFQFIDKVREANACALVHCQAGVSRSATLVIAYVMSLLGLNTEQAYRYVKEKRPTISPNFNFLGQLVEFEQELQATPKHLRNSSKFTCSPTFGSKSVPCGDSIESGLNSGSTPGCQLGPQVITASELARLIHSPTTAMSRLSFNNLSPLQEQVTPPMGEVPTNQQSARAAILLALNESESSGGVTIRLGAKHTYAGSKRPLSSPTFGIEHDTNDELEGNAGGRGMKQKRSMARPNSIGIVPVGGLGRPGEGWNFSSNKSDFSWKANCMKNSKPKYTNLEDTSLTEATRNSATAVLDIDSFAITDERNRVDNNSCNNVNVDSVTDCDKINDNIRLVNNAECHATNKSTDYSFNAIYNKSCNHVERVFCHPEIVVTDLLSETVATVRDNSDYVGKENVIKEVSSLELQGNIPLLMPNDCNHDVSHDSLCLTPNRKARSLDDILESSPVECASDNNLLLSVVEDLENIRQQDKPPLCETRSLGREFARISKDKRKAMIFNNHRSKTNSLLPSSLGCDMQLSILGERSTANVDYKQTSSPIRESPSALCGSVEMIPVS